MNHRFSIIYTPDGDARFNWDYYLNNHLPLAVGTSLKHAAVVACDVDRPVQLNGVAQADHVCICEVYFRDLAAQGDFRRLFTEHEDAAAVVADQPNYTQLSPRFVGCEVTAVRGGRQADAGFRARLLVPPDRSCARDFREHWVPRMVEAMGDSDVTVEFAEGTSGIPPGSPPDFHALLNLYAGSRSELLGLLNHAHSVLPAFTAAGGELLVSEHLTFDLDRARIPD